MAQDKKKFEDFKLSKQLLKAIEQVESGGRRDAVSPKGARGRMQVMPATARQPGYKVKPARDESEEEFCKTALEQGTG